MRKIYFLTVLMLSSLCSSVFAQTGWPPPVDWYMIYEWQANKGDRAYAYGQIVYYQGGFYEVVNPSGVSSWGDASYWNPENLSKMTDDAATWDGTADYVKRAEGQLWVTNMGTITAGNYYIWGGVVYECILSGESWGDGYSPTGWNSTSYKKVCDITMLPVEKSCLPDNFVGYWYNTISWQPGWIAIDWITHEAYKCVIQTHVNGGEYPESLYGYWYSTGAWNDPPTPVCAEKDILTAVQIPEWSACDWPLGAIVQYQGIYYIYKPAVDPESIMADVESTFTEEVPGTGTDWTVYDPTITGINTVFHNQITYFVKNGYLVVNSQDQVSIQLYNLTGQIVETATDKSIKLPTKGVYIAKINTGGNIISVKVLN